MECPYIPELSYSEFGQRLKERTQGKRYPFSGSFELTARCNVRCQHCYISEGPTGKPGKQELSTAEVKRILDEISEAGTLWLLLTGGEPLIRRDFAELYTYAKQKGFILTLFTNGTMLTPRIADLLAELPPRKIEITLYGYTQETYERVTGVPGSHARCLRGIELLLERKLPLNLKTMVMTINQHELQDMRNYAESLGVDFRYDAMLNGALPDGCGHPKDLRLSPQDVVQLDLEDEKRLQGWREFMERYQDVRPDPRYLYQCGAGIRSFHVDSCGMLSLCVVARNRGYDLRDGNFTLGWSELGLLRQQPAPQGYLCGSCELSILCGTCPGWSELEKGYSDMRVEYMCQVAHMRASEIGL
jgi:MoaA/NifB/PqqE/SkfB family radical SAM enzyme